MKIGPKRHMVGYRTRRAAKFGGRTDQVGGGAVSVVRIALSSPAGDVSSDSRLTPSLEVSSAVANRLTIPRLCDDRHTL